MKFDLKGIVPAAYTPMLPNGDINFEMIDDYAVYFAKEKVDNVFILGTAGEGCSLTNEERMRVAERWIRAAKDRVKNVIVHIGTDNLADTKVLAQHAESIGATAIATVSSFYFRPAGVKQLAVYLSEVAKAAPTVPLMYYHMPAATKVNLNVKNVLDEINAIGVPNFAGVKFTGHDLCDFGQCVDNYGDKYAICYGYDEQVIGGLFLGAQACVGSTYNFAVRLYQRLFEACQRGDVKLAKELQYRSQRFISFLFSVGLDTGVGKALMSRITGVEMGPPRLPEMPPSDEKMETILKYFHEIGFFEWIK